MALIACPVTDQIHGIDTAVQPAIYDMIKQAVSRWLLLHPVVSALAFKLVLALTVVPDTMGTQIHAKLATKVAASVRVDWRQNVQDVIVMQF